MKKIFVVFLLILFAASSFVGCSKIEYNAAIIDDGIVYRDEWFAQNCTWGSSQSGYNEYLPENRTFEIRSQSELNAIFLSFPMTDFDEKIVIVYCYTTVYTQRQQVLKKVKINDGVLTVEFNVERGRLGHADASAPCTRLCVICLDKVEFTKSNVIYTGQ